MLVDNLAQDISQSEEFQRLYKSLLQKEASTILSEPPDDSSLNETELDILLECAVILATVYDNNKNAAKYHDTAYRIAILLKHYYEAYAQANEEELYLIFSRLGRYPIAVQYFKERDSEVHEALPILLFGPEEFSRKLNTIHIGENHYLLTNFQKKLWNRIHKSKQLAVCAPTSAGKSFILTQYLVSEYFAASEKFIAVYVVPTNALINEISNSILEFSHNNFNSRPNLYTTSVMEEGGSNLKAIYVLTQEKLSSLLAKIKDSDIKQKFSVDLLIVDEAQIIADGERGGITKNVIEELLENNPQTHIVLGSPPIQNLEGYGKFFELKELTTYPETISPVAKNIIRICKQVRSTKKFDITIDFGSTQIRKKSYEIQGVTLDSISKCLASFAKKFGKDAPSLIYASGPGNCLRIAKELKEIADELDGFDPDSTHIKELSAFIFEYIHPEFELGLCLQKGVGFHFGALPLIVTKQLEEKFRNYEFPFLVSTSTLLHGVNLPAKNLFLCRPKKGKNEDLDNIEFWNLVGRAGRLGKDFQGNIFVIEERNETEEEPLWSTEYIASAGNQVVESALDKCLKADPQTGKSNLSIYLNDILKNQEIPSASKRLENVFAQLYFYQRKGRLEEALERSSFELEKEEKVYIIQSFKEIARTITISGKLLDKFRDISPLRIESLYKRLSELAQKGEMEGRIPIHPRDNKNSQSYESLAKIFGSLWKQFGVGEHPARQRAMARIAFKWMEGENYNILAKEYVDNKDFGSPDPTTKIYNFFKDLQNTISYEYAKYMRCYIDVLELVNKEAVTPFLPNGTKIVPLHSFLEEGTYITSQLSLIRNGLSRMSAIEVYRVLGTKLGQNLDLKEVKESIKKHAVELKINIHPYFYQEVCKVFDL